MVKSKKSKLPIERPGIKAENPELYYTFDEEEIGRGKFSVVKKVTCKKTSKVFAAKIIRFDEDNVKFAIREYDLMVGKMQDLINKNDFAKRSLPELHEAYLVRKYLIIVMTLCDGMTLLDFFGKKHSITEEDVAIVIRWMCEILHTLHSNNIVHLDIRPTNIRMTSLNDIKLVDWNSARHLANKKAGEVVDVIGDTEFCAPEMLSFDRVQPNSDMWSVAVIMYILLSGVSPYFYEDEAKVSMCVEKCILAYEPLANASTSAVEFIKKVFKRGPEMRLSPEKGLQHKWLSQEQASVRKSTRVTTQDLIGATDLRLYSEEEEEYIEASLIFRTFDEEEHVSTEEEDSDQDQD